MQSGFGSFLLSIIMLGAFLLAGGGIWMVARRQDAKRGTLMLLAALVLLANVLIWTL